jgi:hypothetical protein
MKNTFLTIFLVLLTSKALAYNGWSTGEILKIRIQSNKILITQSNANNPVPCTNTGYIYLSQGDSAYHKNMFASLLTAYAAKKEVSLAISGCSSDGYPAVSEVWIK